MLQSNLHRWRSILSVFSSGLTLAPLKEEPKGLATGRTKGRSLVRTRSRVARAAVEWLHALHLYGALGISAFGSAICAVFGWDHSQWVPLWFFGALLVFNIDRALPDAADVINLPKRRATSSRLRWVSWVIALLSGVMLVWWPILQRDWFTLVLVLLGSTLCLSYSLPLFGHRLKEVPLLKTFFAPSLVVLAILSLPLTHDTWPSQPGLLVLTAVWAWGYLLCNMLLCDLRDIKGDRRTGVVSIPVRLGRKATFRLVWILIACTGGLAFLLAALPGSSARLVVALWGILGSAYVAGLAVAAQQRRSERFYEWWVEGMLFLPAVVVVIFR